jgi:hypothetical protein
MSTSFGAVDVTVAGAGSTYADSTTLSAYPLVYYIASGANASGVELPSAIPGTIKVVFNSTGNSKIVYPPVGGQIDKGGVNTGVTLTTLKATTLVAVDDLNYVSLKN